MDFQLSDVVMSIQRFEYLFARYVQQRCTAAELEEFMTMIHESKYDLALQNLLKHSWDQYQASHHMNEGKARLIYENILLQQQETNDPPPATSRWWIGVAAAFLVLAFVTGLLYFSLSSGTKTTPAVEQTVLAGKQHQYIRLPDGSTVILHAGSKLLYPDQFTDATRTVTLIGQGYFDIVRDTVRPFRVLTGKLITTVLGTAFNIKADPGDEHITVTVNRGKVQVGDGQENFGVLTPDQQVTYNTTNKLHKLIAVKAATVMEWQEQDLFFDNTTMEEAARQLEHRYGIEVHFNNASLLHCRFTGTFGKHDTAEKILQIICSFNNASYTINGKEVTISGQGCE